MISLEQILEPGILRAIHKKIRSGVRANHLADAMLFRDPLLLAPADYEFDKTFRMLKLRVLDGSYRPKPPQIVYAAKAPGLRRPLTFLQHDDAVLLKALCQASQPRLFADFPSWVSFGRGGFEKKKAEIEEDADEIELEYEGWFLKWLKYRRLLATIAGDPRPLVVISDVANFFPSIDLALLRDRFARAAALDEAGTGLLFHIVDSANSAASYRARAPLGLPQDRYDASRILAHFFIRDLDDAFEAEGKAGRYTRWVDDLAVSVQDELEGWEVIGRIQDALARIRLHPNTSKTTVISKDDFKKDHYEDYNDLLDHVKNQTGQGTVLPELRRQFERELGRFLADPSPRCYWYRVLKRFYTQSRRIGSSTLAKPAPTHLRKYPGESASILDYLAYRPSDTSLPHVIFDHLRLEGRLYEDVQILAYEALMNAALPDDQLLRWFIVRNAYSHLSGRDGLPRPSAYVRGLIALAIYKFGAQQATRLIAKDFSAMAEESAVYARHVLLVLYATQAFRGAARKAVEHLDDPELRQLERFLVAVEAGDNRALGLTFGLLEPKRTKLPRRLIIPARALPLLAIARRASGKQGEVNARVADIRSRLMKEPAGFRDGVTLSHL